MEDQEILEPEKPRDINQLIDLPYSEMTEAEIELVIEFKAAIKARDEAHERRIKIIQDGINEQIRIQQEAAIAAQNKLDELTAHAINRFNEVSNNG